MKILVCSHTFAPNVGGIETVTRILAEQFVQEGHRVTVVTQTPGNGKFPYHVERGPRPWRLFLLGARADAILQCNISLRTLIPLLPFRRRVVVAIHTWIARTNGSIAWQDHLKRLILRTVTKAAVSSSLARSIGTECNIVPNPFECDPFEQCAEGEKTGDLVFLGRLVSDKGCDLLLKALGALKKEGFEPGLTIIGDGPERRMLEQLCVSLGLACQVQFLGTLGTERARVLATHKVLVVPSRWNEPFGLVALEGIACGCAVIGTSGGGLPEAIGPCGVLVPNGDTDALARSIRTLVSDGKLRQELLRGREKHLKKFTPKAVCKQYLELLTSVTSRPDHGGSA